MKKSYLLLDVGGTQIKGGLSDKYGNIKGELLCVPSLAKEIKETIFDNFLSVIRTLSEHEACGEVIGIGMAFPGPFDYAAGISLMKGMHKYDSIYGIPIERELKDRCPSIHSTKFVFLHDVEAFALGVSWFGEAKDSTRFLCLCIGTGAGSAFVDHKVPLKGGAGVPADGWLYNDPYKDSVIDDYLSARGLESISREVCGQSLNGSQLYELCRRGDQKAHTVYRQFGEDLKQCIRLYLDRFQPDAVVMGGQISKSFSYFGEKFQAECDNRGIKIYLETETSIRAMQGLYIQIRQEGSVC